MGNSRLLLQKENPNPPFFYCYIIFKDIMKKVSFWIAPISDFDAEEMLQEIKAFQLLDGFRARDVADFKE